MIVAFPGYMFKYLMIYYCIIPKHSRRLIMQSFSSKVFKSGLCMCLYMCGWHFSQECFVTKSPFFNFISRNFHFMYEIKVKKDCFWKESTHKTSKIGNLV